MVGLYYPVLMWSELFELLFEELRFLIGDCFLVQDEDITDIVVVYLRRIESALCRMVVNLVTLPFPSDPS